MGTQSSTPQTSQIGHLLIEVMISRFAEDGSAHFLKVVLVNTASWCHQTACHGATRCLELQLQLTQQGTSLVPADAAYTECPHSPYTRWKVYAQLQRGDRALENVSKLTTWRRLG